MKIMVIADYEEPGLWDYFNHRKTEGTDLIISCGDLKPEYLEFLTTMVNCPLIFVRGNHDDRYDHKFPEGCIPIDDKMYDIDGIKIFGLGGSYRYRDSKVMFTEKQMKMRILKAKMKLALRDRIDILVTHAPAKGYGDLDDYAHQGFDCFNDLLYQYKPKYLVHGHVHKEYGNFQREIDHPSGTKIINAYGHVFIEI